MDLVDKLTLLPEVEALIEHAVKKVLRKSPGLLSREKLLVETLVKALEKDANWVSLYSITGQLKSPPTAELSGELDVALREAKEVQGLSLHDVSQVNHYVQILMDDSRIFDDAETWREVIFPMDLPQMNVS
jgi:hypothetical protein